MYVPVPEKNVTDVWGDDSLVQALIEADEQLRATENILDYFGEGKPDEGYSISPPDGFHYRLTLFEGGDRMFYYYFFRTKIGAKSAHQKIQRTLEWNEWSYWMEQWYPGNFRWEWTD